MNTQRAHKHTAHHKGHRDRWGYSGVKRRTLCNIAGTVEGFDLFFLFSPRSIVTMEVGGSVPNNRIQERKKVPAQAVPTKEWWWCGCRSARQGSPAIFRLIHREMHLDMGGPLVFVVVSCSFRKAITQWNFASHPQDDETVRSLSTSGKSPGKLKLTQREEVDCTHFEKKVFSWQELLNHF